MVSILPHPQPHRPPAGKPSPSGRGLGEGEPSYVANLADARRPPPSFPPPHRHSRESGNPPPAVLQTNPRRPPPSFRRRPESRTPADAGLLIGQVWIPAFAGMTKCGAAGWPGLAVNPPFILRQAQDERLPPPPGPPLIMLGCRHMAFLPHPTLSRWERAFRRRPAVGRMRLGEPG